MNSKSIALVGALVGALYAAPALAEVRLCTGASDGNYAKIGDMVAKHFGPGLTVVKDTGGTWGNVERTAIQDPTTEGACDAFIGQPDGPSVLKQGYYENDKLTGANPSAASKLIKIGTLHREYLYVLTPKGGADSIKDLEGTDSKIAVGAPGSGGWLIWQNLVYEDSGYASLVEEPTGGFDAGAMVASGIVDAAIIPAGLGNGAMNDINELFGDKLQLAEADDGDFNDAVDADGKPLYEFVKLDGNNYPALVNGYFSGSIETISWLAGAYINADRVSKEDLSLIHI